MFILPFLALSLRLCFKDGSALNSSALSLLSHGSLVESRFLIFLMASLIYFYEYSLSAPYLWRAVSAFFKNFFLNSVTSFPASYSFSSSRPKFSVLRPKFVLMKSFGKKKGFQPSFSLLMILLGRFWLSIKSVFRAYLWLALRLSWSMLITRVQDSMILGLPLPTELTL